EALSRSGSSGGPNSANRSTCPGTRAASISVLLSFFLDINATIRLDKKANHLRQRYYRRYRHELATRVSPHATWAARPFLRPSLPMQSALLRNPLFCVSTVSIVCT